MRFQYPFVLLLLLPALTLLWRNMRMKHPSLRVSSLKHFTGSDGEHKLSLNRYFTLFILEFFALIFLVFALARPQTGNEKTKSFKDGIDIVFSLDISHSMLFYDHPQGEERNKRIISQAIQNNEIKNRVFHAKKAIQDFSAKRDSDRLGLVIFAGEAYSMCPPTNDHEYLLKRMETIEPGYLGDYNNGTNITAAISGGLARLEKSKSKKKVVILVTDGSHTASTDLTPELAAKAAGEADAVVYTIGIGSGLAWAMQQSFFGNELQLVEDGFDEELLKTIAEKTDGKYFPVSSPDELQKVFDSIDELEKITIEEIRTINYAEHFQVFLFIALALLGLAHLLSNTVLMRYP
jgi:Ca-activated chloride channel homolog